MSTELLKVLQQQPRGSGLVTMKHHHHSDSVGWVTGRLSGLSRIPGSSIPKTCPLQVFGGPGLTWSNLWKDRPVIQRLTGKVKSQS